MEGEEINFFSSLITAFHSSLQHCISITEVSKTVINNDVCLDRVSLHEVKTRLSHNLRRLENQGLASRADNYQSLLNAIAADIVNQRQHRISRKMVGGMPMPQLLLLAIIAASAIFCLPYVILI